MAVARFGNGRPSANQDLLLYTVERSSLISVVAVNLSGATKITAWIIPNTKEAFPDQWIYFGNQIPITSRNTFETFKTAVNVGDKVYVKSESGNVSFFINGVYDIAGTSNVRVSATEPQSPQIGDVWINDSLDERNIFYWTGSEWEFVGNTGPSNILSIGTVEAAGFGEPADATITGDSPEQVLNLVLPMGPQGPPNSLSLGSVTTAAFGDPASVELAGESPDQEISFVLPRGEQGPANILTIEGVSTGAPGSEASVEIFGNSPNQTLSFVIPQGPVGPPNTLTVGSVTAVGPEEQPAVTITGAAPNQTVNFTLQQGIQGPPGDLGTATLKDFQDVDNNLDPVDGSILVYDSASGVWSSRQSSANLADLYMVIMEAY